MSSLGGPNIVTSGLVLHLDAANPKSYPGTGNTWYDRAANLNAGVANNGTLVNEPTFDSGNGGSIVFDGTNDYVTLIATPSTLGMISGNFTVNIWIYNNGTTKGGLVSSQSSSSAGGQYEFSINSVNSVKVTYYGGGSVNTSIVSNTWYMLTHTYNYSTKSSKLYKNGLLVSSITMTVDLFTTGQIYIGWYGYGGGYFRGNIPIVQIYKGELSATEVLQNYNATKSRYGL